MKTTLIGIAIALVGLAYVNPEIKAGLAPYASAAKTKLAGFLEMPPAAASPATNASPPASSDVVAANPASAQATPPTTAPPGKPFVQNEPGKVVKVRGVKMPGNCLQLVPEMVTYVEQHGDKKQPGYVDDKDIPDYVCGWY